MGGGSTNTSKSIVFYCESSQYYDIFKSILDALDRFSHPYTYYTSNKDDLCFFRNSPFGTFSYIGKGNRAYSILNRLNADIFVLTTPGLDVLQIKRNRGVKHYCHIVHALTPMTYRVFGIDYFDSVLVANSAQLDFIRDIESAHNTKAKYVAITGSTYLDELSLKQDSNKNLNKDSNTILVSPSWGKESLLFKFGLDLLLPLAQSGYHIIIRPHPQSFISKDENENIKYLQESLQSYSNIKWDKNTSNIHAFNRADMMISDFSSVIFDFVCLCGKPVLSIDNDMDLSGYDMADIPKENIWTFKALELVSKRIKKDDFKNIKVICDSTLKSKQTQIEEIKNFLWQYPHNAGERAALELLKIERDILESSLKTHIPTLKRIRELDMMLEEKKAC